MTHDRIRAVIGEVLAKQPLVPGYSELTPARVIECKVSPPVKWDRAALESALKVKLPDDLVRLWHIASEVRLYDDVNYGQWGCILWSPDKIVDQHRRATDWREPEDFRPGDLIIGEFRGDTDLVVLRCDPSQANFGSIVIALGMDPRNDWPCVASSIGDFMVAFLAHPDRKFWEPAG
jgi:hypothetical protein